MTKRQRTPPDPSEFNDPLSNYDGHVPADEMERSIVADPAEVIDSSTYHTVEPDTTVAEAVHRMSAENTGCLVVIEDGKPIGIFSERDVLARVADAFDDLRDQPVRSVMTEDPVIVFESDHPSRVLNLMAEGGFRHLPVVDADGRLTGVIGARHVTAYLFDQMTGT